MKKLLPLFLILLSIGLFASVLSKTNEKIGQHFPGYLTFENGVVGAFYVPDWTGHKEGMTYNTVPTSTHPSSFIFSSRDFILTCVLPAVVGLLFLLLGVALCMYIPTQQGRAPLFLLHILIGNYLILTPDFHLTYQYTKLLMVFFALIPATAIHFWLLFPEEFMWVKREKSLTIIPYAISIMLMVPYIGWFDQPKSWVRAEYAVFFYMVLAYIFWVARLIQTLKHPQLESNRIIARYLLIGQVIAFTIPLICALAIFLGDYSFPLNLAAPFSLLFPISLFMGVILARLRQSQIQLIQSEKNAALGNLLAGLAHEINNPMTFIYSSIEPLREMLTELKNKPNEKTWKDVNELVDVIQEGAIRSKDLIEGFRYFSHPDQKEKHAVDLQAIIDQSLQLLKPKWKNHIKIEKNYAKIPAFVCQPTEMGQVFVNIISNACYAIHGSGKIVITTELIHNHIVISIKDTGIGMNKEIIRRIFDPFYTTKPQGEGTGLGLSTTLEIVKKYHGTIQVKSEVHKGSEFVIELPVGI